MLTMRQRLGERMLHSSEAPVDALERSRVVSQLHKPAVVGHSHRYVSQSYAMIPSARLMRYRKKCRWLLTPTQLYTQGQWLAMLARLHPVQLQMSTYWSCLATHR